MKLDGDFVFDAGIEDVWDALFDPAVLAAVLPGCEKLERVGEQYVGDIKVKVGPITGKFTGKVDLLDQVRPTSYTMKIDGRGTQGFVTATAGITLAAAGDGKTKIAYTSDAQIGGKIATVGQRLVEASAKAIVKQSLEGLNENIQRRAKAYREAAAAEAPPPPAPEPTPAPEPPAPEAPAAAVDEPEPAPAPPAPAEPPPAPEPAKPVVVEYKKADATQLGKAVAKEVTKIVAPIAIGVALVLAIVIYLLVR